MYDALMLATACVLSGVAGGLVWGVGRERKAAELRCAPLAHQVEQAAAELTVLRQENQMLKRDASRFSTIINTSLNPVWMRNDKLQIIYCNLAFSELAEATTEAVVAVGDIELFNGHSKLARKAWDSGQEQAESRHVIVEGERRLYRLREVPLKRDGIVIGYATDQRDIEQAQDEIQRHVAALRDLLGSSTSAMAIYGRDARLKFYNYAFAALWKFDEDWLDTEPSYGDVLELLREKRKLPEQANFAAFKQAQLRLFTNLLEPQEEFFYLPDGKILRVIAIPHALGGVLFAYEDVTDRLALERSYNTLIAVQRETLDNLNDGIVVFGENGRMKLCNPVFLNMWSLPPDLAASEPHIRETLDMCRCYFSDKDWEATRQDLIVRMQQRNYFVLRIERTDQRVIDCACVPLPDGASLLSFTDVTASMLVERSLREKNEALEAADRMKTEFLASVSYELRSPLTTISGFAEMLQKQYMGALNDTQSDYVGHILSSSRSLGEMISNIIDLASIEAGYLKLVSARCDVQEILHAVLSLLSERVRIQDVYIEKSIDAQISHLWVDEVRFKQICFNMLSTAIKLAKQKGTITLSLQKLEGGGVELSVAEDGRSSMSVLETADVASAHGNIDLGLSVARRFVELHGGSLHLTRDDKNATRIHCIFPHALPLTDGTI